MKPGWHRFNLNLTQLTRLTQLTVLSLLCLALAGCQTPERTHRHVLSTLRIHLETPLDKTDHTQLVQIFREQPVSISIAKDPILTEAQVSQAKVVDVVGGFELQIEFGREGKWLLEEYTVAYPGRHLVIFSQFQRPENEQQGEARWLAAPKIRHRITDGVISFTPDATRKEADEIALGLNHVVAQLSTISKQ
jgi:hypothetical protein